MAVEFILTHPGSAHKDDFLACSMLMARHGVPVERRDPNRADLENASVLVIDIGGEHDPEQGNFDHHQFPRDHDPVCALSLVMKDLGIYEDAKLFCEWLEPAEWFDSRGAGGTAKWLGVERDIISKLNSPMDITLLRRFARVERLEPGEVLYEAMRWVGQDLLDYLNSMRERLSFIDENGEIWDFEAKGAESFKVLFMPRTNPLPVEPSSGLGRYLEAAGLSDEVAGLIYPDRRGSGYGLARHNDNPRLEFTRIDSEDDVHFAHARGFVAKTSATEKDRLMELMMAAWA